MFHQRPITLRQVHSRGNPSEFGIFVCCGTQVLLQKVTPEDERGYVIPMNRELALGPLPSALLLGMR
jgi:hypothetical protein